MKKEKPNILSRSIPASSLGVDRSYLIKGCILGHTGSGKTQASVTLPLVEGKSLLLIDYDGRSEVVAGEPHVEIISVFDPDPTSPRAWDDGEKLRKELWAIAKKGDFPYSGVIEDSLSMVGTIAMNSALLLDAKRGLGGAPAQQHWLPQIHFLRKHINSMRMLPCHYLLNGHFDFLGEEATGELKLLPKITKSLRTELPSWFNETYYAYRERGKGKDGKAKLQYFWITGGSGKYEFFKSTLNHLGKYWNDPVEINFDDQPTGFEKLMKIRFPEGSKDSNIEKKEKNDDTKTSNQQKAASH